MFSKLKTSVAAAAALLCLGSAQAGFITRTITFEDPINTPNAPFAPLFGHGDEFYQNGFFIDPFSNSATAQPGDLVGALVNGADVSNTCVTLICPTNNATKFYTGLDDGLIFLARLDGLNFSIDGFDAAFVGDPVGLNSAVPGRLIMQGVRASDGAQLGFVAGNLTSTNFLSYTTSAAGALRNTAWSAMYIWAQTCPPVGACSSFNSDRGQFALDNLRINVIPEPTSLALVGAALAGLGLARRRRQA